MTNVYNLEPGDAIFAHSKDLYGTAIRYAEALRWWRGHYWNHMAIVESVDDTGQVWCIEMARRCERVRLEDVAPGGHLKVIKCPDGVDRARAVAYAQAQVGIKYAVLTIVSIVFSLFTPSAIQVDFHRGGPALICSALVARAWEHGGWDCPVDPFQISPAQFDMILGNGGYYINLLASKLGMW